MNAKKIVTAGLALVMVAGISVAGTMAFLTDLNNEAVNTFTVGNVDISLAETTSDYKMIPGDTIAKDPKVTVKAGSEASWVFVKLTEENNTNPQFITYGIAAGWTPVSGEDNVWYKEQAAIADGADDVEYYVLACQDSEHENCTGCVKVSSTITNADMTAAKTNEELPTLTVNAYAIQQEGFASAELAWAQIETELTSVEP